MNKYELVVIFYGMDLIGSLVFFIDFLFFVIGNNCGWLYDDNVCSGMYFVILLDDLNDLKNYEKEYLYVVFFFYLFLRGYRIRIMLKSLYYCL